MGTTANDVDRIDVASVARVLSEIADITSENVELGELVDRVADSSRKLIPFSSMSLVRIVEGDAAVLQAHSHAPGEDRGAAERLGVPLTAWSATFRPRPAPYRIDDAAVELDPAYPADEECLRRGIGSAIWEPFRRGNRFVGGLWVWSRSPRAFDEKHHEVLKPVAALLAAAVAHWQLSDAERRRRERLDGVEALLATIAESLDLPAVLRGLSASLLNILPHDFVTLTDSDTEAQTFRVLASAGECDASIPTHSIPLTAYDMERRTLDFEVVRDVPAELRPDTERQRIVLSWGHRSWIRVPVMISGEVKGALSFFHREPARYGREDAEIARRVADRLALMLAYQRLGEQSRAAAQSRERAERLEARVATLVRELESRGRSGVVGASRPWKETLRQVGRVAASDTTVLLTGESGTGKEVVASLIHQGSQRAGKPFVAINCAALPEQLLESELFGYERGAFTGAIATKVGRIELAEGGSLFLDEIAEMSPLVQAKLLRVLEEREFQRVGGTRTLKADVRIITATNRDLPASIARRTFREDLYYRLNVFQIHIAPLRERADDVLPLAEFFLEELGRTMGRRAAGISSAAREWLREYPWPGNVRELRNAIERALLLCDGSTIATEHLASLVRPTARGVRSGAGGAATESVDLGTMERRLIENALTQSRGNKSKAARLLGVSRAQLYTRLEKYGLR